MVVSFLLCCLKGKKAKKKAKKKKGKKAIERRQ